MWRIIDSQINGCKDEMENAQLYTLNC